MKIIMQLSKLPGGFHYALKNPDFTAAIDKSTGSRLQRLVAAGHVHPVKVEHRVIHYFDTLARADEFARHLQPVKRPTVTVAARAPWPANAEPVITDKTRITVAPPAPRHFRTNTHSY